jgi:HEAT repeat protein
LVTLAGHTSLQVSISAAVLIANSKPEEHPQWNQVQGQLRSTTNAYRGFECLLPGPDQYTRFYNPPNRRFAIAALGIIGPPAKSTAPSLVRILKSDDEIDVPLWCQAAGSLREMGIDEDFYLPILRKRFGDSEEELGARTAAAHALACAKASDVETIALLRGGLNDAYAQVRLGAARSLLLFGEPFAEVQPTLTALLKHRLVSMRSGALRVLAEIGPAASPLRSEVNSLLDDKAPTVRTAAQEALQSLSQPPEPTPQ